MNEDFNYHDSLINNIIYQMNTIKVVVTVPSLALVTDADISDRGEPYNIVDGVVVKESINNRRTVMLPIMAIMRIYYEGYTIYTPNRNDVLDIAVTVKELHTKLISSLDYSEKHKKLADTMNDFINIVYKTNKVTIDKAAIESSKIVNPGIAGFDTIDDADKHNTKRGIDLRDVVVK